MEEPRYDVFVAQGELTFQMNDAPEGYFSEDEANKLLEHLRQCGDLKFKAKDGSIVCFPNLTGICIYAVQQGRKPEPTPAPSKI